MLTAPTVSEIYSQNIPLNYSTDIVHSLPMLVTWQKVKYSREIYPVRWHGTCNAVYLKVVKCMEDPLGMRRVPAPAPSLKKTMIVSNFVASKVDKAYVSEGPVPQHSVTEREMVIMTLPRGHHTHAGVCLTGMVSACKIHAFKVQC